MRRLFRRMTATANPVLGGAGGIDLVPVGPLALKGCAGCNDREVPTAWRLRIGWRPDPKLGPEAYRCNVTIYFCAECLAELGDLIATVEGAAREVSPEARGGQRPTA